ncbi:uncharacterized protein EV422DRAFT_545763 [Fimicolochytrium jonesii]|uniref:uncharacterized protein n=1 Tax=Fimicolochytrium jonesii TaxID=1396493 RepID=UPI0022FF0385|nr:uncharacterized protein EV422DRAFT_545763 [Fimicolochytrium jonesii]KAI8816369.1 hypothetical protein EV422DRAFT_545763 [Fimicolochytrium jonesii]
MFVTTVTGLLGTLIPAEGEIEKRPWVRISLGMQTSSSHHEKGADDITWWGGVRPPIHVVGRQCSDQGCESPSRVENRESDRVYIHGHGTRTRLALGLPDHSRGFRSPERFGSFRLRRPLLSVCDDVLLGFRLEHSETPALGPSPRALTRRRCPSTWSTSILQAQQQSLTKPSFLSPKIAPPLHHQRPPMLCVSPKFPALPLPRFLSVNCPLTPALIAAAGELAPWLVCVEASAHDSVQERVAVLATVDVGQV